MQWLNENRVNYGAVEIRAVENGYGLFANEDLKPDQIPLELQHKLMLSLDYSAECSDIKLVYSSIERQLY